MVAYKIQIKSAKIITDKDKSKFNQALADKDVKKFITEKERKAYERGLSEGKQIGFKERNEEVKNIVEALSNTIRELHDTKFEIINKYEPEVVKLAVYAAEKLVAHELAVSGSKIDFVVKDILNKLPGATMIKIRLHPEDLNELVNLNEQFISDALNISVEFVKDNSVSKGGCYVESDVGDIDALLKTRISNIKEEVDIKPDGENK